MNQKPDSRAGRTYIVRVNWVDQTERYARTHVSGIGKVTFSFNPDRGVWKEDAPPIHGAKVVLRDLRSMDGGWRAFEARYLRPEDEDQKVNE